MSLLASLNRYNPERISVRNPSSHAIDAAISKVQEAMQGLDAVAVEVPRDILADGMNRLTNSQTLPPRLLRQMCFGGLAHVFGDNQDDKLIVRLLAQVEAVAKAGIYHALLKGYLIVARSNDPLSGVIRQFLEHKRHHFNDRVLKRVTQYELLSPSPGKKLASMIMLDHSQTPQSILAAARFNSRGEGTGFLKATFAECCDLLTKNCSLEQIQRFFEYTGQVVIFKQEILIYTKTLLGPWEKSGADPDEVTKALIQNFLIEQFGDPRINRVVWHDAGSAKSVLLRWLVAQSLDLMLQVLSASNDTGQWKERAKFWRNYIQLEVVTDAWVVFGRDAYKTARQMVKDGDLTKGGFGRLHGGGAESMHSVLLMRMGDLVISEWTHSGKVRFFTQGNPHAPKFYQQTYHPHVIRNDLHAQEALVHHINWQSKFVGIIHQYTGFRPSLRQTNNAHATNTAVRDTTRYCTQCNEPLHRQYLHNICLSCNNTNVRTR